MPRSELKSNLLLRPLEMPVLTMSLMVKMSERPRCPEAYLHLQNPALQKSPGTI
jgi:hypothetical protein